MMAELQQDCHLACYSETSSPQLFQFSVGQLKESCWRLELGNEGLLTPQNMLVYTDVYGMRALLSC